MNDTKMKRIAKLEAQKRALEEKLSILKDDRGSAIRAIVNKMNKEGVSFDDLLQYVDSRTKYKNPVTGATWSGKGRKPFWLEEELQKGKKLEDFLA